MMKKINILLLCLFVVGCKFTPYSGNDIYNEKAKLPEDEAPHFKNSLEWWYFTGHLNDVNSSDQYGVEYVIFHFNPKNKKDYLMSNFAITDPQGNTFRYDYKILKQDSLLRPELPIDLELVHKDIEHRLSGQMGEYKIEANMPDDHLSLKLETKPAKPILLHNSTGYENYGEYAEAGYYSYPRLEAKGQLFRYGKPIQLAGELWYDRQWNCIGVWQKQVAWEWFSVQLNNGQELMLYRLHHFGDNKDIYGGTFYGENGEQIDLKGTNISIEATEYWKSGHSKTSYPVSWEIKLPSLDVNLNIKAVLKDQELGLSFSPIHKFYYWEGMCAASGTMDGVPIAGQSYVEMTNRDAFEKQ
ncbi:lipocalin family protein [Fulvivirga sediminis]|uniref:AttH domain-containing protein n=1 Tax=Fulvivirga sediminis TaxID=2803949 RepID=A0A937F8F9_9BACT|nr:lipocalin family protein [Fulvivirga sediminis]MBL3655963.1 hypothetical protein [Fulvivirga sediminis]